MLRDVPEDFDGLQEKLTKSGFRILCLAAKEFPAEATKGKDASALARADIESDLEFCGLLALRNSIKPQVSSTVKQLRRSYHRVIMITGDNPLTACQVATQAAMSEDRFLILDKVVRDPGDNGADDTEGLEWRYMGDATKSAKAFSLKKIKDLARKYSLCVPG
eukprot:UN25911